MKELTIEEKAKAYDSIFERLKKMYNNNKTNIVHRLIYERYFPELAESEDEKIRKFLIKCVQKPIGTDLLNGIKKDDVIAWLEKQGEQKPAQETESFEAEHGKYYYCIKDYFCGGKKQASKGDVVQALRGLPIMGLEDISEYFLPVNNIQKHTWSEEDEERINDIMWCISAYKQNGFNEEHTKRADRAENWLKSLEERVQPQPKQELNEEVVDYYVDLGLPSGTKWKSANEVGYYTYDEAVNKFGRSLPSKEQWEELEGNCIWVWKGTGYDVVGPNGKTIYLSAAGCSAGYSCTKVYNAGICGYYWSRTFDNEDYAYYMQLSDNDNNIVHDSRNCLFTVRLIK